MHALKNLEEALRTFAERKKVYGDSYRQYGQVMRALFPNGVSVNSPLEFNRLGVINMIVSKLTRYSTDFATPHLDSIHDIIVYSAILEELDAECLARKQV